MSYKTQKIPFFRVLRIFLSYDFLSAVPQGTNVRYHKITKSRNEMPQKVEFGWMFLWYFEYKYSLAALHREYFLYVIYI